MTTFPDFLTTDDLATEFNVIPRRVRALAAAREVGRKMNGGWIFTRDEMEELRPGEPGAAGHKPKEEEEEEEEVAERKPPVKKRKRRRRRRSQAA